MAVDRLPNLLDRLRETQLLEPPQLEELSRLPEAQSADPRPLARQVIHRGWLTAFQINQVLNGRAKELVVGAYRLLNRLGEGGMGQVFKAHHQPMNRVVALKVIRREKLNNPEAVKRFYQEVQAAAQLAHPNIVIAFDAGKVGDNHYLAMEFVDGIDLAQLVKQSGPLPVVVACDYVRQAALGLQHAYERGLVHRDIKPSNLLVSRATAADRPKSSTPIPAQGVVKILDMGLARWHGTGAKETGVTQMGAVIGTPDYIAPEQALDSRVADIRADLYSLGCTFYFLLTGKPPFVSNTLAEVLLKHQMDEAPPLAQYRPDVPPGVQAIVSKLMAKRPEERYQTPAELVAALEPCCGGAGKAAVALPAAPTSETSDNLFDFTKADEKPEDLPPVVEAKPKARPKRASRPAIVTGSASDRTPERRPPPSPRKKVLVAAGIVSALVAVAVVAFVLANRPGSPTPEPDPNKDRSLTRNDGKDPSKKEDKPKVPDNSKPGTIQSQPPQLVRVHSPSGDKGEARRFDRLEGMVTLLTFSADGQRALMAGTDKIVRLFDLNTGEQLQFFVGHTAEVSCLALSPNGQYALTAAYDKTVRLWDTATGKEVRPLAGHASVVGAVAFSPDGRRALTGGGLAASAGSRGPVTDCTVRLWDVATGKEIGRPADKHTQPIRQVACSVNGRRLVTFGTDEIWSWDLAEDKVVPVTKVPLSDPVACLAVSPDGRRALFGSVDRNAILWDLEANGQVRRFAAQDGPVTCVCFLPDGRHVLSGGGAAKPAVSASDVFDCSVRLWDAETGQQVQSFEGHTNAVQVVYTPDGRRAHSFALDRTLRRWELVIPPKVVEKPKDPPPVVKKLPRPAEAEQAEALKRIREVVLKDEYKALGTRPGPEDQLKLAARLLEQARDTQMNATERFVLLNEAQDRAGRAGNGALASTAIDELARDFDLDPLALKSAALAAAGKTTRKPEDNRDLAELCLELFEEALIAERPADACSPLLATADACAKLAGDGGGLSSAVKRQRTRLEAIRKETEGAQEADKALQAMPDDPDNNLKLGRYLCLLRGNWSRGLAYLKKGNDADLKGLAARELERPNQAPAWADLGDAWWKLAQKERGLGRTQLYAHAFSCYQQALPQLVGASRADVEKRMNQVREEFLELRLPYPVGFLREFKDHTAAVTDVAYSPDGRHILSASERDKTLRLWEAHSAKMVKQLAIPGGRAQLALGAGGRALLGLPGGNLRVIDLLASGKELPIRAHKGDVLYAAFYVGGLQFITGGKDKFIRFWDTKTGNQVNQFAVALEPLNGLAISADGRRVVAMGERIAVVYNGTGGQLHTLEGNTERLRCVAISRDGRRAITGAYNSPLRLWNLQTGKELHALAGARGNSFACAAFSADGRRVVAGGFDRTVSLWDVETGKLLETFEGHTGAVLSVAFSPDGRLALSGSEDNTLRLWGLPEQKAARPMPR